MSGGVSVPCRAGCFLHRKKWEKSFQAKRTVRKNKRLETERGGPVWNTEAWFSRAWQSQGMSLHVPLCPQIRVNGHLRLCVYGFPRALFSASLRYHDKYTTYKGNGLLAIPNSRKVTSRRQQVMPLVKALSSYTVASVFTQKGRGSSWRPLF